MFSEVKFKASNVRSLSWCDDSLVDWVAGGIQYFMDGTLERASINYAYAFDSAVVSPSGNYVVLYTKNQTKALLLKNGEVIREINRSFYYADVYDFPIVFAELAEGREVLIHCPNEYCQLDIEDLEAGKIITQHSERNPSDCFHSRLSVSPSGKWLLSAGWVWHPVDVVGLFDLSKYQSEPTLLDKFEVRPPGLWEISSAAFLNDSLVFVSSSDEFFGDEGDLDDDRPGRYSIALWSIEKDSYLKKVSCNKPVGELMPLCERYVVSFYEHPKLWDLDTGKMVHEWVNIDSGLQINSITMGEKMPAMAIDIKKRRFAIMQEDEIVIITFDV